ncbi:hypothetical protein MMC16_007468 [Acarospora aff. strigata]|nr:hypothetical protein [Acarospora aff. strigata]
MSLLKGIQSAVFYYVSCAPCTKLTYRRKRKAEATRSRQEKAAIEEQQPGLYPHPSPFSTNIYWHEEMSLGPGPPFKKGGRDKGSRAGSKRELTTGGQGSSMGSSADTTIVAETGSPDLDSSRLSREGWNRKRYQREDEVLWGYNGRDSGGFDGLDENSSIGLSGMGKARKSPSDRYCLARNPAVNDLHPPVVSTQPTHKSETRWMLQPPPSAKIMEGKVRANRSRSGSGNSSRRGGEAMSLGRRVGERLMEEKVRKGERPPTGEVLALSREKSRDGNIPNSEWEIEGQPHDRNTRRSTDSANSTPSRRNKRPPPLSLSDELEPPAPALLVPLPLSSWNESQALRGRPIPIVTLPPSNAPEPDFARQTDNTSPPPPVRPVYPNKPRPHQLQPVLTFEDSSNSLHTLQGLSIPTGIKSKQAIHSPSVIPLTEPRIRLAPSTSQEDAQLYQLPECETWFPLRDFKFPAPEQAQQRVMSGEALMRRRRSMDF